MSDYYATLIRTPLHDPEHVRMLERLPEYQCGMFSCQYYLSMIQQRDYFATNKDEFPAALRAYVIHHAAPDAMAFDGSEFEEFVEPFMKQQFEIHFGLDSHPRTKEEEGMVNLIEHPEWDDEQIRRSVNTTDKQMDRWRWYRRARAVQRWNS